MLLPYITSVARVVSTSLTLQGGACISSQHGEYHVNHARGQCEPVGGCASVWFDGTLGPCAKAKVFIAHLTISRCPVFRGTVQVRTNASANVLRLLGFLAPICMTTFESAPVMFVEALVPLRSTTYTNTSTLSNSAGHV